MKRFKGHYLLLVLALLLMTSCQKSNNPNSNSGNGKEGTKDFILTAKRADFMKKITSINKNLKLTGKEELTVVGETLRVILPVADSTAYFIVECEYYGNELFSGGWWTVSLYDIDYEKTDKGDYSYAIVSEKNVENFVKIATSLIGKTEISKNDINEFLASNEHEDDEYYYDVVSKYITLEYNGGYLNLSAMIDEYDEGSLYLSGSFGAKITVEEVYNRCAEISKQWTKPAFSLRINAISELYFEETNIILYYDEYDNYSDSYKVYTTGQDSFSIIIEAWYEEPAIAPTFFESDYSTLYKILAVITDDPFPVSDYENLRKNIREKINKDSTSDQNAYKGSGLWDFDFTYYVYDDGRNYAETQIDYNFK